MSGHLPAFVYCLLAQTSQDYLAYIAHDGPSQDGTKEFMEEICAKHPDNFTYYESPVRMNTWGHNLRQYFLDTCDNPYVHFENADNLLYKIFVEAVVNTIKKSPVDLITNSIQHSYFGYEKFSGKSFMICETDFANFTVKAKLAKQIKFNEAEFAADGHYIMDFRKLFPNFTQLHIDNPIAVHQ